MTFAVSPALAAKIDVSIESKPRQEEAHDKCPGMILMAL